MGRSMWRKRIITVLLIVLIIVTIGYLLIVRSEIRQFAGTYKAVDAADSEYELTLSKTGKISVADVGAGNPVLEGHIYKSPFKTEYYLKAGGETDDVFLDLGECKGKAKVWLSAIGQTYVDPAVYRIIIIETETAHMKFNEKSYFK